MSLRSGIRDVLGRRPETASEEIARTLDRALKIVQMQLGAMARTGEAQVDAQGLWSLTGRPPAKVKNKPRKVAEAAPEPEPEQASAPVPFDAGVWLDGSVLIQGADIRDGGIVLITPEQALQLRALLARAIVTDPVAEAQ